VQNQQQSASRQLTKMMMDRAVKTWRIQPQFCFLKAIFSLSQVFVTHAHWQQAEIPGKRKTVHLLLSQTIHGQRQTYENLTRRRNESDWPLLHLCRLLFSPSDGYCAFCCAELITKQPIERLSFDWRTHFREMAL